MFRFTEITLLLSLVLGCAGQNDDKSPANSGTKVQPEIAINTKGLNNADANLAPQQGLFWAVNSTGYVSELPAVIDGITNKRHDITCTPGSGISLSGIRNIEGQNQLPRSVADYAKTPTDTVDLEGSQHYTIELSILDGATKNAKITTSQAGTFQIYYIGSFTINPGSGCL